MKRRIMAAATVAAGFVVLALTTAAGALAGSQPFDAPTPLSAGQPLGPL